MDSSSSDSDSCGRVKNLHNALIMSRTEHLDEDENYNLKHKIGQLIFNAYFETGNLSSVEQIDQYEYDLIIRPDVANPRYHLWFNFTVSNQRANQCVIFTLINLSENVRLFHEGLTPVVRSRTRPIWTRLHEDQVFYYRSANHGNRLVLSISFRFSSHDDEHQFALLYPYSATNFNTFINRWMVELKRSKSQQLAPRASDSRSRTPDMQSNKSAKSNKKKQSRPSTSLGFSTCNIDDQNVECRKLELKQLCSSILSKPIHLLSLTSSKIGSGKATVMVICRMGGNLDGPASLVCQGLVDFLLSKTMISSAFRQLVNCQVVPILDIDSISVGNSRTDILGQVNQTHKMVEANKSIYESFNLVNEMINKSCNEATRTIVIELGVNMNLVGSRIIGTHHQDSFRMERHLFIPRLLARFAEDFYLEHCEFHKTCKSPLISSNAKNTTNFDYYRLEVSPFAYYKRSLTTKVYQEYNQYSYLGLGKAIVYSVLWLLKSEGRNLPDSISLLLNSYLPTNHDIDDVLLDGKN